jgi:hypothetical protein
MWRTSSADVLTISSQFLATPFTFAFAVTLVSSFASPLPSPTTVLVHRVRLDFKSRRDRVTPIFSTESHFLSFSEDLSVRPSTVDSLPISLPHLSIFDQLCLFPVPSSPPTTAKVPQRLAPMDFFSSSFFLRLTCLFKLGHHFVPQDLVAVGFSLPPLGLTYRPAQLPQI